MEFSTGYASLYNNTLRAPHSKPPVPQRQSRAVETRSIARERLFSRVAPEIVVRCIAAGCLLAGAERSSLGLNLSYFREMDPVFHAQRHSLAWWTSFWRHADDKRVRYDSERPVRARTMRGRLKTRCAKIRATLNYSVYGEEDELPHLTLFDFTKTAKSKGKINAILKNNYSWI